MCTLRSMASIAGCAKFNTQASTISPLWSQVWHRQMVWKSQSSHPFSCTAPRHHDATKSNNTAQTPPRMSRNAAPTPPCHKRIIVAITGATGALLALELQHRLKALNIEIHLVVSKWGASTLKYELPSRRNTLSHFSSLVHHIYRPLDVSATIFSGSFRTDGMIIVPCSMKTLAAVRCGYDNDLISRAAGVTLKERRRLVLVARETPLGIVNLENMLGVARAGAVVFPPVMGFYMRPGSVEELVKQRVRRMIDALGLGEKYEDDGDELTWKGFDWESKRDETGE